MHRPRRATRARAGLTTVLALALAACSSGPSPAPTPTSTIAKCRSMSAISSNQPCQVSGSFQLGAFTIILDPKDTWIAQGTPGTEVYVKHPGWGSQATIAHFRPQAAAPGVKPSDEDLIREAVGPRASILRNVVPATSFRWIDQGRTIDQPAQAPRTSDHLVLRKYQTTAGLKGVFTLIVRYRSTNGPIDDILAVDSYTVPGPTGGPTDPHERLAYQLVSHAQ